MSKRECLRSKIGHWTHLSKFLRRIGHLLVSIAGASLDGLIIKSTFDEVDAPFVAVDGADVLAMAGGSVDALPGRGAPLQSLAQYSTLKFRLLWQGIDENSLTATRRSMQQTTTESSLECRPLNTVTVNNHSGHVMDDGRLVVGGSRAGLHMLVCFWLFCVYRLQYKPPANAVQYQQTL